MQVVMFCPGKTLYVGNGCMYFLSALMLVCVDDATHHNSIHAGITYVVIFYFNM